LNNQRRTHPGSKVVAAKEDVGSNRVQGLKTKDGGLLVPREQRGKSVAEKVRRNVQRKACPCTYSEMKVSRGGMNKLYGTLGRNRDQTNNEGEKRGFPT